MACASEAGRAAHRIITLCFAAMHLRRCCSYIILWSYYGAASGQRSMHNVQNITLKVLSPMTRALILTQEGPHKSLPGLLESPLAGWLPVLGPASHGPLVAASRNAIFERPPPACLLPPEGHLASCPPHQAKHLRVDPHYLGQFSRAPSTELRVLHESASTPRARSAR